MVSNSCVGYFRSCPYGTVSGAQFIFARFIVVIYLLENKVIVV